MPQAEVPIMGVIGVDVAAMDVDIALSALPDNVDEVLVRITSRGGSVIDGHAIFSRLRESGKRIITVIEGGALSAGAIIAQAGDERRMHSNALLMVHGPLGGNSAATLEEHQAAVEMLQAATEAIVATLVDRTGRPDSEIRQLLSEKGEWMSAEAAKEAGFVDVVLAAGTTPDNAILAMAPDDLVNEVVPKPQTKESPMSEPTTPAAATIKELEAAFKDAPSEFVLDQLRNEATLEQAEKAWTQELQETVTAQIDDLANLAKERDDLQARIDELQAKIDKPAASKGVDPVNTKTTTDPQFDDPQSEFKRLVDEALRTEKNRQKAVRSVVKNNPELHAAMLQV